MRTGQLAVFGAGDTVTLGHRSRTVRRQPLDVLLLGGRPIREPVALRPVRHEHQGRVVQAFEDFQAGRLGTIPAVRTPLPEEPHPGHDVL